MTDSNTEAVASIELPNEPVVVELTYKYQPVDERNRPLGGEQVIKYTTHEELVEKLTKQNTELVKALRNQKKKNLLGQSDQTELPKEMVLSEAFSSPRELTSDERTQLSRDLLDPEKSDQATDLLFEAKLGAKPEKVRSRLEVVDMLLARSECEAFLNSEPRYYKCPENFETLTSWMVKNNLAATRDNFSYAFDELSKSDYLLTAPIVREEVVVPVQIPEPTTTLANSQPTQVEPSRITTEEPAPAKRPNVGVSSGLTRETASNDGVSVNQRTLTLVDIDNMPADLYRQRLKDPAFKKAVDDLLTPKNIQ